MNLRRLLATAALAVSVAGISACSSAATTTGSPSTPPSVAPSTGVTGAGPSGSAATCTLLSSSDIQSALGEQVTGSRPMGGATIGTLAQVQECVLATDGPPLLGSAASTLQQLANTLTNGATSGLDLTTGGVAVVQATTSIGLTAAPQASSMPGIVPVPGIGQQAFVATAATGGGVGFAQLSPTSAVLVVDVEGKQVTSDQMTALLKAAASH
jgi:hypothetical protein